MYLLPQEGGSPQAAEDWTVDFLNLLTLLKHQARQGSAD
jgi:hypothetical protein